MLVSNRQANPEEHDMPEVLNLHLLVCQFVPGFQTLRFMAIIAIDTIGKSIGN